MASIILTERHTLTRLIFVNIDEINIVNVQRGRTRSALFLAGGHTALLNRTGGRSARGDPADDLRLRQPRRAEVASRRRR